MGTEQETTLRHQQSVGKETAIESHNADIEALVYTKAECKLHGASYSNEDSGGQHSESPEVLRKRTSDSVYCGGREDGGVFHESGSVCMSVDLKMAMDQLDAEQKSWEEQLAKEQHKKEVSSSQFSVLM